MNIPITEWKRYPTTGEELDRHYNGTPLPEGVGYPIHPTFPTESESMAYAYGMPVDMSRAIFNDPAAPRRSEAEELNSYYAERYTALAEHYAQLAASLRPQA